MPRRSVNNDIYRELGHAWWDEESEFASLRFFANDLRCDYFLRMLDKEHGRGRGEGTCLDVGCGGGFLAEEFAMAGFRVTGVDPAVESIEAARAHAASSGLSIEYRVGTGEALPFPGGAFDFVLCCDVLEHVRDVPQVVREISRVLKPNGFFFYDTINRTFASWIVVIKAMQEWESIAFAAPDSHVWDRFIKPDELTGILRQSGFVNRGMRGMSPRRNIFANLIDLRRRAMGKIGFRELGRRLALHESGDLSVCYMGYALKGSEMGAY